MTQITPGTLATLKYAHHSDGYVVTAVDDGGVTLRRLPAASRARGQAPLFFGGFGLWSHLYTEAEAMQALIRAMPDPSTLPELVLPMDGADVVSPEGAILELGHALYLRDMSRPDVIFGT